MGVSNRWPSSISELISRMEMRLRAPVTRGYFFLLGALRLVNAASPRNIDQKKVSSGTQGNFSYDFKNPVNHRIVSVKVGYILIMGLWGYFSYPLLIEAPIKTRPSIFKEVEAPLNFKYFGIVKFGIVLYNFSIVKFPSKQLQALCFSLEFFFITRPWSIPWKTYWLRIG